MGMAAGLSLIQVAAFAPEQITHERLAAIAAALATLQGDGERVAPRRRFRAVREKFRALIMAGVAIQE
jgi:hypothetical protein